MLEKWLLQPRTAPPPVPNPEFLPIFNQAALLEFFGGDRELAAEICRVFLEDTPGEIEAIKRCLETEDLARVQCKVHGIKGAAATIGGQALRTVAFKLEEAAKVGDSITVNQDVAELEAQFDQLKAAIEQWLQPLECPEVGIFCA
jgi:HPt (histidine-containing phosphotransfer) domain-containing protein